jgi:hypothetical protein
MQEFPKFFELYLQSLSEEDAKSLLTCFEDLNNDEEDMIDGMCEILHAKYPNLIIFSFDLDPLLLKTKSVNDM